MSLIQDALKRQMDEQAGQAYTPPPAPKPPKGGGTFGKVVGMLFALVLLLGTAGVLFYMATKNWSWKDAMKAAEADFNKAEQKISALADSKEKAPSTSASNPLSGVQGRVEKMKNAVIARESEAAIAMGQDPAPASTEPESPKSERSLTSLFSRDSSDEKSWPKVTVNGIMSAGSANGAALLNNRMVSAGENVEGARLVEVQAKGAVLEFRGETRLVLIGQTTE